MDDRHRSERAFFDALRREGGRERCGKYYSVLGASRRRFQRLLEEAPAGARVLEMGCGDGSWTLLLAGRGARAAGFDLSREQVRAARERAARLGRDALFCVMDGEKLACPDQSFDLVYGAAVIHHLDLRRAYGEIARVLRPGGRAVFVEPMGHNPLVSLYRRATPALRTPGERPLRRDDLRLAEEHFGEVRAEFSALLSLAAAPLRGLPFFPGLVRALDRADRALFRLLPFLRLHAWQVVLTLSSPRPRAPGSAGGAPSPGGPAPGAPPTPGAPPRPR